MFKKITIVLATLLLALMDRYRATGEFPLLVQTQEQRRAKLVMLFGQPKFSPYSVEYKT